MAQLGPAGDPRSGRPFVGGLLLASFVLLARANRRALRYADLASSELRLKIEMLACAREAALAANHSNQFLASMSHELRTPLNTVIGLTEAMLQGKLRPLERGHAQMVLGAAESLLATIEDMLDLARIDAEKLSFGVGDVRPLPHDRRRDRRARGPRKRQGPRIEGKHRPGAGSGSRRGPKTTPSGDPQPAPECDRVYRRRRGGGRRGTLTSDGADTLRVEVRDTGVGIDPALHRGLFEAFEPGSAAAARRSGGAGLGLPICKRLVEQMGGEIGVEDRPGGGSTFWFTARLPACEADAVPEPAISNGPVALPKRVLLVEDSIQNQRVALAILGPEPEVVIAANGREACDRLAEGDFDVILMDVEMPVMDGLEATAEIRAREAASGRRTPIVAMTAHFHADDRRLCLAAGMDGYVSKPVRRDELLGAIGQVLRARGAGTPAGRSMIAILIRIGSPIRPPKAYDPAMTHPPTSPVPRAKRIAFLVWGIACYALFFAVFLYAIAFIGNFEIVPKTIDSGEPGPLGLALAVNLGLLSLFAVQHSVMARPAFKRVVDEDRSRARRTADLRASVDARAVVLFALLAADRRHGLAVTNGRARSRCTPSTSRAG